MPSRVFGTTPSETWLAWQLDESVRWFGEMLEARRYRYDKKTGQIADDRIERLLVPPQFQPKRDLSDPKNLRMTEAQLRAFEAAMGG